MKLEKGAGRELLSELLSEIETLPWDGTNKRHFSIPSKQLLDLIGKSHIKRVFSKETTAALFRKYTFVFQKQLSVELTRSSETSKRILLPIIEGYRQYKEKKPDNSSGFQVTLDTIGSWLLTVIPKHPDLLLMDVPKDGMLTKSLRLYDQSLSRAILCVSDVKSLNIKGCQTKSQLMNHVVSHWGLLKNIEPFSQCASKQHVLTDLSSDYTDVIKTTRCVTSTDIKPLFANYSTYELGKFLLFAFGIFTTIIGTEAKYSYALNLSDASKRFFSELSFDSFRSFSEVSGIVFQLKDQEVTRSCVVYSGDLNSRSVCVEVQMPKPKSLIKRTPFYKDRCLPEKIEITANGLCLKESRVSVLEYSWYTSSSGIIDLKRMHHDACNLAPKAKTARYSFEDFCLAYGFQEALDRFVSVMHENRNYPTNSTPVFDLSMIPSETQEQALSIHRATGNYSEHIIGYSHYLLKNVCVKKRCDSQIDRNKLKVSDWWLPSDFSSRFSPKDYCLLKACLFDDLNDSASFTRALKTTFDIPVGELRVPKSVVSLMKLKSLSKDVQTFLNSKAPFLVFSSTSEIDHRLSYELLLSGVLDWEALHDVYVDVSEGEYRRWLKRKPQSNCEMNIEIDEAAEEEEVPVVDVLAPTLQCHDQKLIRFFDHIARFISFMGLKNVTNELIYKVYDECKKETTPEYMGMKWFWDRLQQFEYRNNIWLTQLRGKTRQDMSAFRYVYDKCILN